MSLSPSNWFHDTVSALAYSFAQPHAESVPLPGGVGGGFAPPYNDLTQFILRQHANMPDYLRAPMRIATLGFDAFGILKGAKPFHRQTPPQRQRQIAAWKNARVGFQRDLIRYFESLATLALYSREERRAPSRREGWSSRFSVSQNDKLKLELQHAEPVLGAPPSELRAEIVVIGSGPGGAITACLLAEAGRDVLLVEEGPFLPLESCTPFSKDEMEQKYRNGGQTVAMGRNKITYVEGRCVGGGSEINSGLYHRTPPDILERWRREFQVEALSESDLTPHFETCERDVSVSLLPGAAPAASLKLHAGATKLGWKSLEIPRWFRYGATAEPTPDPSQEGNSSSASELLLPSLGGAGGGFGKTSIGKRQSMTETYVPRFLRAGGRLLPGTRAHRLRQNGAGWIVEANHHSSGTIHIATDALFLCAGAVQSPALLRRSGITQNVGNSLQVHPTVKIVGRFPDSVNATDLGVPVHQVKEFAPRLSFGCSISSPAYLALGLIDHPEAARETARTWQNMATYYAMITSEGSGTVRSLPGFRDPLVRYALTENDRRNLADGLKKLSQILFEAGATELYPGLMHRSEFRLQAASRGTVQPPEGGTPNSYVLRCNGCLSKLPQVLPDGLASLMTIHLFSSCPMGEDQSKCATDSFGRVHVFKNLFVNDASLLCTAPGVNPQGSIMALARRNALRFLESR